MAALRLASLWERRLSGESDTSDTPQDEEPIRLDVDPFDISNPQKPRLRGDKRRVRRKVSDKKPPVAPPLASGAPVVVVEEEPLPDCMSPVSSFVGSAPNSPRIESRGFADDAEMLRRRVEELDLRIAGLTQRQKGLFNEVDRLKGRLQQSTL